MKDSNLIDYISEKYADGDLTAFFKRGLQRDYISSEFGKKTGKRRGKQDYSVISYEEEITEELLKSLHQSLKNE